MSARKKPLMYLFVGGEGPSGPGPGPGPGLASRLAGSSRHLPKGEHQRQPGIRTHIIWLYS